MFKFNEVLREDLKLASNRHRRILLASGEYFEEILAIALGHTVNEAKHGYDAKCEKGFLYEYKVNTYTGETKGDGKFFGTAMVGDVRPERIKRYSEMKYIFIAGVDRPEEKISFVIQIDGQDFSKKLEQNWNGVNGENVSVNYNHYKDCRYDVIFKDQNLIRTFMNEKYPKEFFIFLMGSIEFYKKRYENELKDLIIISVDRNELKDDDTILYLQHKDYNQFTHDVKINIMRDSKKEYHTIFKNKLLNHMRKEFIKDNIELYPAQILSKAQSCDIHSTFFDEYSLKQISSRKSQIKKDLISS